MVLLIFIDFIDFINFEFINCQPVKFWANNMLQVTFLARKVFEFLLE